MKKIIKTILLGATLLITSLHANAVLVTQDIIFNNVVEGSISFDPLLADEFDTIDTWQSFDFLGVDFAPEDAFVIELQIDPMDIASGLQFLLIDVVDSATFFDFQGIWEAGFGGEFNAILGGTLYDNLPFDLGSVNVVPEPSVAFLIMVGAIAIAFRRKKR
ncbi:PEP-CTERM sorting domain-containing protein [Echinimonas agarilytica]|uniref:PEP-CTERM sorting domain-containing protein n=1 Tax=Echinimonas agarilytica TaxID=1215918 RepID=A0AA42B8V7_9GAMM|nr:PEP-CTERM sorting domain-containing protein [Echinimonas agarilytica]MCM2680621.1 PEP-CTERM sorting domain-containing protein [Echinimonas agarilytica]